MRDDATLATDVFVVDDGQRRPVLLVRTPYSRSASRATLDPVAVARDGWAVVIQDVRGLGDSDGEFVPFLQEITDGEDTIAWCASQPWSDGRVAMYGGSYVGATQWLAAISGHDALKAIAPAFTASDYRDGWTYDGGAFAHGFVTSWATKFAASSRDPTLVERSTELSDNWEALLARPPHANAVSEIFPPYATWLAEDDDSYWNAISIERRHRSLGLPTFHVGGWYDIFCEGTIRNYLGMRASATSARARRLQRLVIGPWTHHAPWQRVQGDLDFGRHADRTLDVPHFLVDWLRSALDGDDAEAGASIFVMGENRWIELDSWPPPTRSLRLYLDSGRLVPQPLHGPAQSFTVDPSDPVPSVGGRGIDPVVPTAGPRDQRDVEGRDDVLVYTSDPFPQGLTVMGPIGAELHVSTNVESVDVAVKVCLVEMDGRSINVVDSIRRQGYVPGEPQRVAFPVGSTAIAIPAGARVRVQVSGSNFPRFDRNPSLALAGRVADVSVHSTPALASWIDLPVEIER
jgi:putative CocE/NonD family hydrolase